MFVFVALPFGHTFPSLGGRKGGFFFSFLLSLTSRADLPYMSQVIGMYSFSSSNQVVLNVFKTHNKCHSMYNQWASLYQQHKKQYISFQRGRLLSSFLTQHTRQQKAYHRNSFWLYLNLRQSVLLRLCSSPPGIYQPGIKALDAVEPNFLLPYWYLITPDIIKGFISEPNNYL